jgi:hypothetical protein
VGVGAVAELHALYTGRALGLAAERGVLLAEVVGDRSVVVGGLLEGLEREPALRLVADGTLLAPLSEDRLVVGGRREDRDPAVVLGRRPEEGDAANVNLLDRAGERAVGLLRLEHEGVQVAGDDRDGRDRVGREVGQVGRDVAREDACKRPDVDE